MIAIDVKSDWTDADAELAERSRVGEQRVEPERDAVVGRLAHSLSPTVLAPDELELLAGRGSRPSTAAGAFAGTAASSPPSRSTRSRSSATCAARWT